MIRKKFVTRVYSFVLIISNETFRRHVNNDETFPLWPFLFTQIFSSFYHFDRFSVPNIKIIIPANAWPTSVRFKTVYCGNIASHNLRIIKKKKYAKEHTRRIETEYYKIAAFKVVYYLSKSTTRKSQDG